MSTTNEDFRTAAEAETIANIAAQVAAGEDPFGDDEPLVRAQAEDETTTEQAEAEPTQGDDKPAGQEQAAEVEQEEAQPTAEAATAQPEQPAAPAIAQYNVLDAAAFKDARSKLIAEKNAAFKQLNDGDLDTDAYLAIDNRVQDALDELTAQRALALANVQNDERQQLSAVQSIIDAAKASGEIDYLADTKAQTQFDALLVAVRADPDFSGKSFAAQAAEAHRTLVFRRGITKPATESAATAPVAARPTPPAPPTLRGVPTAATPNTGGGLQEQLSRLGGLDFQDAIGRIPKSQRDAYLDS